jgi:Tol biopolymer transport system component
VSRDRFGGPANDGSGSADISANGRFVTFASSASDLVEGDDNEAADVFVRDLETGTNEMVSVTRDGEPGNRHSGSPRISPNGRFVAFDSRARNLSRIPDTNRKGDVFIHDRKSGTTNRVSVTSKGRQADDNSYVAGVSNDGTRVAFVSFADNLVPDDTNEVGDAFVYDRKTQKLVRASVSSREKESFEGGIATDLSPDGRYAVFYSWGDDLVPGDSNESSDVFVRDLRTGKTTRISLADDESQANNYSHNEARISADGCLVTFDSGASNLVEGDTNDHNDIFVRDRCNNTTTILSQTPEGTPANADSARPRISADGTHIVFASEATNLAGPDENESEDVFLATR